MSDYVPEDNKIWNDEDWPKFRVSYCHYHGKPDNKDVKKSSDTDKHGDIVHHLHYPRFVGHVLHAEDGSVGIMPTFIDDPGTDAQAIAKLMRLAGEWYNECGGMK